MCIVLLFTSLGLFSQNQQPKGKKIECTADRLIFDAEIDDAVKILYHNVVFTHEGAICYADTAYWNQDLNTIDAYGKNLVIHVNDSVSLYGTHVQYDGNTKIAYIDYDVKMESKDAVLYADKLEYSRIEDLAYYNNGGRIESGESVLISKEGWFYTAKDEVYFKDSVNLTTPEYIIDSDTLKYNTLTDIAYFLGPTIIHSDSDYIYCEYGWYETNTDVCEFQQNAKMYNKTQCLSADTLWYDKPNDIGIARRTVSIVDSVENMLFFGQYAEYKKREGFAYLTDSAVAVFVDKHDSLFMHSDVMYIWFDSNQEVQHLQAFYSVRFFREDLQGSADSVVYIAEDSVIWFFNSPVMWSNENQLLADTIRMYVKDREISEIHYIDNASIFADVFNEEKFNQVKGEMMIAYFKDNAIDFVFIDGSAESLYYLQEENKDLIGVNKSTSSQIKVFFEENEIYLIRFYENINGKVYPLEQLDSDKLNGFIWLDEYRPKTKASIFENVIYKAEKEE
ncbi:MAG: hypothetical protein FWH36_02340 [Lentimicrobiaceae bacterium]|nr:hypothetical protein [Lentimicrobiaceae bacterium]